MKAYTVNNHLVGVGNSQILGTDQGAGTTYTAGQYISIDDNDVISVTGLAPVSSIPDVSDMATKTWVGEQGYLTEVPSNYATDTEVSQAIASSVTNFVTEEQVTGMLPDTEDVEFEELDLSNYALASSVPVVTGYATQTWVTSQGYLTEVPSNYTTDQELAEAVTAVTSIIPAAQVNSDWNANSGVAEILNKPTEIQLIAGTNVQIEVSGVSAVISAQGGGGGTTYTEGNCIDITSNAISWETTAGITDIISVTALPANPVATVIYLIPET